MTRTREKTKNYICQEDMIGICVHAEGRDDKEIHNHDIECFNFVITSAGQSKYSVLVAL